MLRKVNFNRTEWAYLKPAPSKKKFEKNVFCVIQTYFFHIMSKLEMVLTRPTRAYFWPVVNKGLIWLWPWYFLTRPFEIFLTPSEKSWKFDIFRRNFPNPNPNHRWLTRPSPSYKKIDPDPSLVQTNSYLKPVFLFICQIILIFVNNSS